LADQQWVELKMKTQRDADKLLKKQVEHIAVSLIEKKAYTFELKSSLAELDKLSRHLDIYGRKIELPKKFLFEINLVLDELFTNIICYGFYGNREHIIRVTITLKNDEICVCIEDDGIPFNPIEFEIPDMPHSIEDCKIGGLGIHIVRKLMDDICYQRSGDKNVLALKKKIKTSL
jgi:serine/threonine-protein kinase RsbW